MRSVIEDLSRNGCQVKIVHISYLRNIGKLYAFVSCIINKKKDWKEVNKGYYWGEVSEHNNDDDIRAIIEMGRRWNKIPKPVIDDDIIDKAIDSSIDFDSLASAIGSSIDMEKIEAALNEVVENQSDVI
jgi:hypothetical protein